MRNTQDFSIPSTRTRDLRNSGTEKREDCPVKREQRIQLYRWRAERNLEIFTGLPLPNDGDYGTMGVTNNEGNEMEPEHDPTDYEDDGQPTEYEEWQDYFGGDDWDQGQYDCNEDCY